MLCRTDRVDGAEITKNRIPTKIRKEAFAIMSNMGLEDIVKNRNYKKFRETVLQLRQKHGSAFLDEFTIEDIMFDSQSMCFRLKEICLDHGNFQGTNFLWEQFSWGQISGQISGQIF